MSSSAPMDASGILGSVAAIVVVGMLIVGLVGGVMAFETVGEGEVKVVKDKGAVSGQILEPGWHFITPLVQSTVAIDTRPQTYTMSATQNEGERQGGDAVRVLTSDGLAVDVDVTTRYRVTPRDAPQFHEEYRDLETAEERLMRPTIRSELRTEGGNIDVTEIYTGEGQTQLKMAVEEALREELEGSGVTLQTVQVRNVHLPPEYANSIEQKKVRQQKIEEAEYEIQVAEKNKERDIIDAEAEAEQIEITGQALAENPEVLQLRYIEALQENDNTIYVTGSNENMMLTKDIDGENSSGGGN